MQFQIKTQLPMTIRRARTTTYPFPEMRTNQMLEIVDSADTKANSVRSSAQTFVKNHRPGWTVVSRGMYEDGERIGARIWLNVVQPDDSIEDDEIREARWEAEVRAADLRFFEEEGDEDDS